MPHMTLFTYVSLLNVAIALQECNLLEVRDFVMLPSIPMPSSVPGRVSAH